MSGPKSTYVSYTPTAAELEAARRSQLGRLTEEARALEVERAQLVGTWRSKAPQSVKALVALELPVVEAIRGQATDQAVTAASAALARARSELGRVVNQCRQEELRIIARQATTERELAAARGVAAAAHAPRRRRRPAEVELAADEEAPLPVTAEVGLPPSNEREDRLAAIFARAASELDGEAMARCYKDAVAAGDRVAYQSALARARRVVEETEAKRQERAARRAEATTLLESMVGLTGPDVDGWRSTLERAAAAGSALPPNATDAVAGVRRRAVQARLVDVLTGFGYEEVDGPAAAVVGYVPHPSGGATKVRLDREGALFTPVAEAPLDHAAATALDESNCELFSQVQAEAYAVGIRLDLVSKRAVGEAPVRVEAHPFAGEEGAARARARRRRATEAQRRNA